MRGTSDCCHYDEGYDDGLEDGREETSAPSYLKGVRDTLAVVRILTAEGKEIPEKLDAVDIEELIYEEHERNARQAHLYEKALAR